ncbi:beta-lactamase family protein [Luteimonas sp. SJ-92]|uniref:Beta-lactamase family protein n=1 Tax=Luteimonas salinisoli TaxID=2752307 RepID=A0A853J9P9_9GAMM|nr:serine hydrolase domain-containing protein [Luteimonas salinisoli]NZA25474.1 beta-lactamase family protein [Luteimonas salinisoli]
MPRIGAVLALTGLLAVQAATAATPPTPAEFARHAETLLANTYRADAPGVTVLVMRGDEVMYRGARGRADIAAGKPLDPGDRFRIASITKQFAAAGLLTLVDDGKVSLDDPLSKYLPTYPGGARITIEQLLNHTSGAKEYLRIHRTIQAKYLRHGTTAQLVGSFKNDPPDFAPGEGWSYSNSGYVLVGAVIEAASGMPWHHYLYSALFMPLGMNDTGYGADPIVTLRLVKGYTTRYGPPAPSRHISMSRLHAAGALVSTVDDLARWSRALHGGLVLEPGTYTRMITPVGQAKAHDAGYGIFTSAVRGVPALEHGGAIMGFRSHLLYVPGADLTVAVLYNNETPLPAHEPDVVARRLAAAALGDPYPPVKPVVVDLAVLEQYEGVYRGDRDGSHTLRVVDGTLTVQRAGKRRFALTAIAADTFVYPDGLSRLQVLRDASGKVTGMRFWSAGGGEGVVAPLTGLAVPIDIRLPGDALGRLVGRYWAPALLVGAAIAMLYAAKLWRRRRRLAASTL